MTFGEDRTKYAVIPREYENNVLRTHVCLRWQKVLVNPQLHKLRCQRAWADSLTSWQQVELDHPTPQLSRQPRLSRNSFLFLFVFSISPYLFHPSKLNPSIFLFFSGQILTIRVTIRYGLHAFFLFTYAFLPFFASSKWFVWARLEPFFVLWYLV